MEKNGKWRKEMFGNLDFWIDLRKRNLKVQKSLDETAWLESQKIAIKNFSGLIFAYISEMGFFWVIFG